MNEQNDAPVSPFVMERLMREAYRRGKAYAELNEEEFLAAAEGNGLQKQREDSLASEPREMAQELAYRSYESPDAEEARRLVDESLALDPACVDALTVRAFLASEDAGELVDALEHAVGCGEKELGEEFFAEHIGNFWALVQARPYLRALKQLAEVLWAVGRRFDAVGLYENLLELDSEDNMGNAALLLGNYLAMGEVQRAWDLLEEHDVDANTVCAWSWVLLFLLTGDEEAAADALEHALALNPYVAGLVVGLEDPPAEDVPPFFTAGSPEEAHYTVQILGEAWDRAGAAQMWLHGVLTELGLIQADEDGESAPN